MLGRLLYRIFKRPFLKYYYSEQSKSVGFEKMEKAFVDSNGSVWYRPVRDLDLPVKRFKESQKLLMLIKAGLPEETLHLITEEIDKALNAPKRSDFARIAVINNELKKRIGVFVDPDMLFQCAAIMYIREDETPSEINPVIHKAKVEQLKKDSEGGLYDFFYSTGILAFLPFLATTESELIEYLKESELKMKSLQMVLGKYSTEPVSS